MGLLNAVWLLIAFKITSSAANCQLPLFYQNRAFLQDIAGNDYTKLEFRNDALIVYTRRSRAVDGICQAVGEIGRRLIYLKHNGVCVLVTQMALKRAVLVETKTGQTSVNQCASAASTDAYFILLSAVSELDNYAACPFNERIYQAVFTDSAGATHCEDDTTSTVTVYGSRIAFHVCQSASASEQVTRPATMMYCADHLTGWYDDSRAPGGILLLHSFQDNRFHPVTSHCARYAVNGRVITMSIITTKLTTASAYCTNDQSLTTSTSLTFNLKLTEQVSPTRPTVHQPRRRLPSGSTATTPSSSNETDVTPTARTIRLSIFGKILLVCGFLFIFASCGYAAYLGLKPVTRRPLIGRRYSSGSDYEDGMHRMSRMSRSQKQKKGRDKSSKTDRAKSKREGGVGDGGRGGGVITTTNMQMSHTSSSGKAVAMPMMPMMPIPMPMPMAMPMAAPMQVPMMAPMQAQMAVPAAVPLTAPMQAQAAAPSAMPMITTTTATATTQTATTQTATTQTATTVPATMPTNVPPATTTPEGQTQSTVIRGQTADSTQQSLPARDSVATMSTFDSRFESVALSPIVAKNVGKDTSLAVNIGESTIQAQAPPGATDIPRQKLFGEELAKSATSPTGKGKDNKGTDITDSTILGQAPPGATDALKQKLFGKTPAKGNVADPVKGKPVTQKTTAKAATAKEKDIPKAISKQTKPINKAVSRVPSLPSPEEPSGKIKGAQSGKTSLKGKTTIQKSQKAAKSKNQISKMQSPKKPVSSKAPPKTTGQKRKRQTSPPGDVTSAGGGGSSSRGNSSGGAAESKPTSISGAGLKRKRQS